jgi:hypothetical protein
MPAVNSGRARAANCCARACTVSWPQACGAVWMMPASGCWLPSGAPASPGSRRSSRCRRRAPPCSGSCAEAAAEVGHVAGLALGAALAPAVVDATAWPVPQASRSLAQAACSAARISGRWCPTARRRRTLDAPVAASDSQVARRPANTVDTCSLQIGMMIAVRAPRWHGLVAHRVGRHRVLVAAPQHPEAHHRGEEAGRHPGEQQAVQADLQRAQPGVLAASAACWPAARGAPAADSITSASSTRRRFVAARSHGSICARAASVGFRRPMTTSPRLRVKPRQGCATIEPRLIGGVLAPGMACVADDMASPLALSLGLNDVGPCFGQGVAPF